MVNGCIDLTANCTLENLSHIICLDSFSPSYVMFSGSSHCFKIWLYALGASPIFYKSTLICNFESVSLSLGTLIMLFTNGLPVGFMTGITPLFSAFCCAGTGSMLFLSTLALPPLMLSVLPALPLLAGILSLSYL